MQFFIHSVKQSAAALAGRTAVAPTTAVENSVATDVSRKDRLDDVLVVSVDIELQLLTPNA